MNVLICCAAALAALGAGAADQTEQVQAAAQDQVWAAIREAGRAEFRGSLLIRHNPPVQGPDDAEPVVYSRITVDAWGLIRVDRFAGPDQPGPDASPARTDVSTPQGYWSMEFTSPPRLTFVASRHPEAWGYFGEGPANILHAQRQVSRHLYQRAREMERWELYEAKLKDSDLFANFHNDPNEHQVGHAVTWKRHDDAGWLLTELTTFPRLGFGEVVTTNYTDYRRSGDAWLAHSVRVEVSRPKPGAERGRVIMVPSTDTVVDVGGPAPPETFRPPLPGEPRWGSTTWQVAELTPAGWFAAFVGVAAQHSEPRAAIQEVAANHVSIIHAGPQRIVEQLTPDNEPVVLRDLRWFAHGPNFIPHDQESD